MLKRLGTKTKGELLGMADMIDNMPTNLKEMIPTPLLNQEAHMEAPACLNNLSDWVTNAPVGPNRYVVMKLWTQVTLRVELIS